MYAGSRGLSRNGGNIPVHPEIPFITIRPRIQRPMSQSIPLASLEIRDAVFRELIKLSPASNYREELVTGPSGLLSHSNHAFRDGIELSAGEGPSSIVVQAQDSQNRVYPLVVEDVRKVPNFDWLSQIVVRLPDSIDSEGDFQLSITFCGTVGNKPLITIVRQKAHRADCGHRRDADFVWNICFGTY